MTPEKIALLNQKILQIPDIDCVNLGGYPESLTYEQLLEKVRKYGIPEETRYIGSIKLSASYFTKLFANCNEKAIARHNPVRYGVITESRQLRTYPTHDVSYDTPNDIEFDLNCETVLKTGEPVVVLYQSADGDWLLVQSYNYLGWVAIENVVLTDRQTWLHLEDHPFVVVTGNRILLDFNHYHPAASRKELTMGTRLPLAVEKPETVDGVSTLSSYVCLLPVRNQDGMLEHQPVRIPYGLDVMEGYLPYTSRNFITQAFKMLGERYGWSSL